MHLFQSKHQEDATLQPLKNGDGLCFSNKCRDLQGKEGSFMLPKLYLY